MRKHTLIYLRHFGMDGYETPPFMPCEMCGSQVVDIHHIEPRGRGGSKTKDYIDNLMGLCRSCHLKCEAKKVPVEEQKEIHLNYLKLQSKVKYL